MPERYNRDWVGTKLVLKTTVPLLTNLYRLIFYLYACLYGFSFVLKPYQQCTLTKEYTVNRGNKRTLHS